MLTILAGVATWEREIMLATFRRKSPITIAQGRRARAKAIDPPVDDRRGCDRGDLWRGGRLRGRLGSDRAANIDEVVGDDPEADPAPHSIIAAISAPLETVSALAHTDAPLTPVRHRCPLRNHRFFCSRLRAALLLPRLGMQTRLTPLAFAAASFLAE